MRLVLGAAFCLVMLTLCRQEAIGQGTPPGGSGTTLCLILRTSADTSINTLTFNFHQALKTVLNNDKVEKPVFQPLEPTVYNRLVTQFNNEDGGITVPKPKAGQLNVLPWAGGENKWVVHLPPEVKTISKMIVDAGDKKLEYVQAPEKADPTAKDKLYYTPVDKSSYIFQLPMGSELLHVKCHCNFLMGKEVEEKMLEVSAPKSDRAFMVLIKNFDNTRIKDFYDYLRDPEKIGNVVDVSASSVPFTFAFSTVDLDGYTPGSNVITKDGEYKTIVPFYAGKAKLTRVWMLFPVKKDNIEKELEKFRAKNLDPKTALELVSKSSPIGNGQLAKIEPDVPAKWYEIKDVEKDKGLTRTFQLGDLKKFNKEFGEDYYRLLVYEIEIADGTGVVPGAHLLKNVSKVQYYAEKQRLDSIADRIKERIEEVVRPDGDKK